MAVLGQFADSSSVFSALGINVHSFIVQLVTFLIAFLVLRQFAFKPILKMLDERRQLIEQGITLGEAMRDKEAKLEAEVAQKLHTASAQADKLIATAHDEAKQTIQAAEETARKRAEGLIDDAKEQIKQASDRERHRLEKELVGLVSDVSETIIGEKVDAKKDSVLLDKAFRERKAA